MMITIYEHICTMYHLGCFTYIIVSEVRNEKHEKEQEMILEWMKNSTEVCSILYN